MSAAIPPRNIWRVIWPAALSLFLGPGIGQLYNRQYKKGLYLIVVSLTVLIAWAAWCYKASLPYLPVNLTTIDPLELQTLLKKAATEVAATHAVTLFIYQAILFGLWIYGVADAVWVAGRRVKPISSDSNEHIQGGDS